MGVYDIVINWDFLLSYVRMLFKISLENSKKNAAFLWPNMCSNVNIISNVSNGSHIIFDDSINLSLLSPRKALTGYFYLIRYFSYSFSLFYVARFLSFSLSLPFSVLLSPMQSLNLWTTFSTCETINFPFFCPLWTNAWINETMHRSFQFCCSIWSVCIYSR